MTVVNEMRNWDRKNLIVNVFVNNLTLCCSEKPKYYVITGDRQRFCYIFGKFRTENIIFCEVSAFGKKIAKLRNTYAYFRIMIVYFIHGQNSVFKWNDDYNLEIVVLLGCGSCPACMCYYRYLGFMYREKQFLNTF